MVRPAWRQVVASCAETRTTPIMPTTETSTATATALTERPNASSIIIGPAGSNEDGDDGDMKNMLETNSIFYSEDLNISISEIKILKKNDTTRKIESALKLYEKSHHKSKFLKEVSRKLKLDTEIIQKDIFDTKQFQTETIMARAFKPLPVALDLVQKNFKNFKNLILFMGKSGEKTLNETLKIWDLDFDRKKSITNKDSFLLNIKKIKKRENN